MNNLFSISSMRTFFTVSLFLATFLVSPVHITHAATITVTELIDDDPSADNGFCSLREAIQAANTNTAVDSCDAGTGADTIILSAGSTYQLSIGGAGEDANVTGDLDITDNAGLIIQTDTAGSSATIDADDIDRIFHLPDTAGASVSLTLIDIVVQDGTANAASVDDSGGGILVKRGDLTLTRVTITNNVLIGDTTADGGGLAVDYDDVDLGGTISITDSTISNNMSINDAGGAHFDAGEADMTVNITGSTFSGNSLSAAGNDGGGIKLLCSAADVIDFNMTNSTVSGNTATDEGGGMYWLSTSCDVSISYSTIANNTATGGDGGGIHTPTSTVLFDVFASIIADNITGAAGPDCNGTITSSAGHIVIEDTTGCTLSGITANNQTGVDPALAILADYGGPTLTHNLGIGSNARELIVDGTAGCVAGVSIDQRGGVRADGDPPNRGGANCDSGAVEADSALTPTAVSLQSITATNKTAIIPILIATLMLLLAGGVALRRRA